MPLRIEIVARPVAELRLLYGGRNRVFVFDERGDPEDVAPWFHKIEAEKGLNRWTLAEVRCFDRARHDELVARCLRAADDCRSEFGLRSRMDAAEPVSACPLRTKEESTGIFNRAVSYYRGF